MTGLSYILVQLLLFIALLSVEARAKDYTVTVTAYPVNGPFRSRQLVPLQCTITPTPPIPVMYLWRSSTPNHNTDNIFPSSTPITTVTIDETHPLFGHYYCHVLSASERTTLAVGHVTIHVSGILRPIGTTNKTFTSPAQLQMKVELQSEYSRKNLLNSLNNITYEWRHNNTVITSDQVVNDGLPVGGFTIESNRLTIAPTSVKDAGIYSVKISSFGFLNITDTLCAKRILRIVKNYAIFREVEFHVYNSDASNSTNLSELDFKSSSMDHHILEDVSFVHGEPFTVDASIPIATAHRFLISNPNSSLSLRVFYNGELVQIKASNFQYSSRSRISTHLRYDPKEKAISVTLQIPRPSLDDEGTYEMQLFVNITLISPQVCSDYADFLRMPDGFNVSNVLIGSATLLVSQQGPPQVIVQATKQVVSAGGTESLPILTCSVIEDSRLPVNQLKWTKGSQELTQTVNSGSLFLDTTTISTMSSPFGVYTCEATTSQNKAENSILIAERARFRMEMVPLDDITCLDLSEETTELMLDMLLMELQFSFSYDTDTEFTRENFGYSSINCSSEGRNILMSTDVIYSNSDGSITASVLVETAEEWMNGIRTANEVTFQITRDRPGTNRSLDAGQILAIVLSLVLFGALVFGIVILVTCVTIRQRKQSKKQKLDQAKEHSPIPLERKFIVNKSATLNQVLERSEDCASKLIPTSASYDRLVELQRSAFLADKLGQPPDIILPVSKNRRLIYGSEGQHSRDTRLPNIHVTNEEDEIVYTSLTCTQNYAYNSRQDLSDLDRSGSQNQQRESKKYDERMFFNQRQRSVHHYDYPKVQDNYLHAEDLDSLGYQSIERHF